MKRFSLWIGTAFFLSSAWIAAQEVAVVKGKTVNVRGQASLVGEVITQLKAGEKVILLEEIPVQKPGPGEPSKWARIQLPDNTPVWVAAGFLDPTSKTVKSKRLNVRAGPGENYSVLGHLEKGAAVKEIRTVNGWLEIEAPPGAYAFVAADLIEKLGPGPSSNSKTNSVPPAVVSTNAPPPALTTNAPSVVATTTKVPPPVVAQETNSPPAIEPLKNEETVSSPQTNAPVPAVVSTNAPSAGETGAAVQRAEQTLHDITNPPQPKRIVRREGIVRSTASIQAPTYFELISPETRRTMDYLHITTPGLNLKDYKGRMITVTGEEGIDRRWPSTPVLEVQQLEAKP